LAEISLRASSDPADTTLMLIPALAGLEKSLEELEILEILLKTALRDCEIDDGVRSCRNCWP
jgi:hypothetical protein